MVKTIFWWWVPLQLLQNLLLSIGKVMEVYPFSLKTKGTPLFHIIIFSSLLGGLSVAASFDSQYGLGAPHHCPIYSKIINHCLLLDFIKRVALLLLSKLFFLKSTLCSIMLFTSHSVWIFLRWELSITVYQIILKHRNLKQIQLLSHIISVGQEAEQDLPKWFWLSLSWRCSQDVNWGCTIWRLDGDSRVLLQEGWNSHGWHVGTGYWQAAQFLTTWTSLHDAVAGFT